jgi:hypothetical protein
MMVGEEPALSGGDVPLIVVAYVTQWRTVRSLGFLTDAVYC